MALEELTVEMVVDPDGIRRGFEEALQLVNGFARDARDMVDRADLVPGGLKAGENAAASIVRGLRTQFEQSQAQIKEMLFRGLATPGQADAIGKTAAAEFNNGILRTINQLAASGQLTRNLRVALVKELKEAGLEAGEALRGQIANKLVEVGGHADVMGEKGLRASQKLAFGLQAIAEGGAKAEHGMKNVLETTSSFAGMFGTGGIVVASLAAGALAIFNYFNKAREEMEKTRKKFQEELDALENSANAAGLMNKLRDIDLGTPAARGDDSLIELKRRRDEINEFLRDKPSLASSSFEAGKGIGGGIDPESELGKLIKIRQDALRTLLPRIATLEAERRDIVRRILNPPDFRPELGIESGKTTITAKTDERLAKDAASAATKALRDQDKAARDFASGLRAVAEAAKISGTGSDFIEGINERLIDSYEKVTRAINKQKDAFSPYATELRKVREELEKTSLIKMLTGQSSPKLTTTSFGNTSPAEFIVGAPLRGARSSEVKTLPQLDYSRAQFALDSFRNTLTATGKGIRDGFHNTVGQALAIFTPTGAAMAVFGSIVEGMTPLLEALKEPLRVVGEILGKALAPILKALFPVFKAVAIAATYVGEIFLKVSSVISIGIGSLLKGIGNLLNKLPGSIGNPLKKAGQGLIDFGEAQREAADALRKGRDELRDLEWNDALDRVTNGANEAAEALRNVPIGWNAALAALEAGRVGNTPAGGVTLPETGSGGTFTPDTGTGGGGGGGGNGGGFGGESGGGNGPGQQFVFIVDSVQIGDNLTPKQQARLFVSELQEVASDQFGNSARWSEVRV